MRRSLVCGITSCHTRIVVFSDPSYLGSNLSFSQNIFCIWSSKTSPTTTLWWERARKKCGLENNVLVVCMSFGLRMEVAKVERSPELFQTQTLSGPRTAFQRTLASHTSLAQHLYRYGRTNLGTCVPGFPARACALLPGVRIAVGTS